MFNFKNVFNKENKEFFQFPLVIDKIAEIDVGNNKYHKENLILFDASSQILNAFSYFNTKYQENLNSKYLEIRKIIKEIDYSNLEDVMFDFLEKIKEIEITIAIPLIVLDRNNGLIEVEIKKEIVTEFRDIGYGVYIFTPNSISIEMKNLLMSSQQFPIVITNAIKLGECLQTIEKGVNSFVNEIMINQFALLGFNIKDEIRNYFQ